MPTQMNNLNFEGQNIYAGFDVHLKDWKVTILREEMMLKSYTMPPKPEVLSDYFLGIIPEPIIILLTRPVSADCGLIINCANWVLKT